MSSLDGRRGNRPAHREDARCQHVGPFDGGRYPHQRRHVTSVSVRFLRPQAEGPRRNHLVRIPLGAPHVTCAFPSDSIHRDVSWGTSRGTSAPMVHLCLPALAAVAAISSRCPRAASVPSSRPAPTRVSVLGQMFGSMTVSSCPSGSRRIRHASLSSSGPARQTWALSASPLAVRGRRAVLVDSRGWLPPTTGPQVAVRSCHAGEGEWQGRFLHRPGAGLARQPSWSSGSRPGRPPERRTSCELHQQRLHRRGDAESLPDPGQSECAVAARFPAGRWSVSCSGLSHSRRPTRCPATSSPAGVTPASARLRRPSPVRCPPLRAACGARLAEGCWPRSWRVDHERTSPPSAPPRPPRSGSVGCRARYGSRRGYGRRRTRRVA